MDALAASVISRMNHYLKSAAVARVKEPELKGPRASPLPSRLSFVPRTEPHSRAYPQLRAD